MADQAAQQSSVSAPLPAPPPFYKYFTQDNLAQLRRIRKESATKDDTTSESTQQKGLDILSLPPELRYLISPPPPSPTTTYRVFNSHINPSAPDASLADAGIDQLYTLTPSTLENPRPQLLALARSLLTTFLALVGTLAVNPTLYEERVNDIQTIMFNLHDMVNRYRPHQARESLILVMEERVERIRGEIERVREGRDRVRELVAGLGDERERAEGIEEDRKGDDNAQVESDDVEAQRVLWSEMDTI
jgi:mediator of RNA polymerase II transcription subunit 7